LELISHRTLSGFRSDYKAALDDLFVQVLGMMSAEGLISMETGDAGRHQHQGQRQREYLSP
jgi:transposase